MSQLLLLLLLLLSNGCVMTHTTVTLINREGKLCVVLGYSRINSFVSLVSPPRLPLPPFPSLLRLACALLCVSRTNNTFRPKTYG